MNFLTSNFMNATFTGVTFGLIYALVALSLVLIWQSSHVLNFAQGTLAMLASYVAISIIDRGANFWWALILAVVVGFFVGGATERVLMRPLRGKPEINPIVVMVGLYVVVEAVASMIWSTNPRTFPTPFSTVFYTVGGKTIQFSPNDLFTVVAVAVIAVGMLILFQYTSLGLKMRASAFAPEVARLLGVRVSNMLTLGWMLAGAVGAVAGVLFAGTGQITPGFMDPLFIYGFVAAAIGGLDSPPGAIVGGLAVGLISEYATTFWSGELVPVAVLAGLVLVLVVRPQGLFATTSGRRV